MSDIKRRNPRIEWIARNRLHPEHASVLAAMGQGAASEWQGPNGVIRKNPHVVGFIGPNGIKRVDRSGAQQAAAGDPGTAAAARDTRQTVSIENPAFYVVVVPDMSGGRLSAHDKDLLGLARQLADADNASGAVLAVIGPEHKEPQLGEAGIDRVMHLPEDAAGQFAPDNRLTALESIENQLQPRHWLLPDSALGGGDLGRRLAMRLQERPATGVWRIDADESAALGWRCTARGAADSLDIQRPLPRVVLALAECAEPVDATRHAAQPVALESAPAAFTTRINDQGQVAVDPASIALSEAEFILSAGNGVKDWDGFHQAANVLGATEGASRVAVDDGYMARDRQVGASGTWVTARVYVAVGISGAIQHLQGIQPCEKVIAINMDASCDMIKRADLAVIGDSTEILAALVARIQQQQGERHAA
ncbi:electron transfer flavoprotein subunit alpha [Halomonas sp. LS-001]